MRRRRKSNFIKKYFIILGSILGIFTILSGTGVFVYLNVLAEPAYNPNRQVREWDRLGDKSESDKGKNEEENDDNDEGLFKTPSRTNFMIIGQDKAAGLTDTIMVGSFVPSSGEINIMSVPRDTYIVLEKDKLRKLRDIGRSSPSVMKINSLYAYAGEEYGTDFLKQELQELLGINIDYYVMVDLDGFKSIVDTIGGIDFDVPAGGLYYSDPTQGLYINLKGGMQHLNGSQAEGLVRFRYGYARQDLQRVEVQQAFVKEFIKQLMSKETLMENIKGLIIDFMRYVETDFGFSDIPQYLPCVSSINGSNIKTATIPGYAETINGASYYIYDEEQAKEIVDEFFFGIKHNDESTSEETSEAWY